jgi:hypothetical protein
MSASPPTSGAGLFRRRPLRRALRNWRERHQHPFNFGIHLVGIPMAVAGLLLLCVGWYWDVPWYWGAGGLVLGYLLQYVGHRVEGNDVGEWAAIKRLLGLPYVGIAPGRQVERSGQA